MTDDQVLVKKAANLIRGVEAVGGTLSLTDRHIRFQPHVLNVQREPLEIPLDDVVHVGKRNTLLIVPNGVLVRTRGGTDYKFVVWGRGRLIRLIRDISPAAR